MLYLILSLNPLHIQPQTYPKYQILIFRELPIIAFQSPEPSGH